MGDLFTCTSKTFIKIQTLVHFPSGKPISSAGVIFEISITVPSAGDIIRLFLLGPDNIGVVLVGFLKKYIHQSVKVKPTQYKGDQNQPIIIAKIRKIAIKGIPAGCIGVKIEVLIESMMFIYFPIKFIMELL